MKDLTAVGSLWIWPMTGLKSGLTKPDLPVGASTAAFSGQDSQLMPDNWKGTVFCTKEPAVSPHFHLG